jgi:glyoxylase-like metal-dependent hydrolase (beta-lactamase superfamily II)
MQNIADGVFVETAYEGVNVGAVVSTRGIICIDVPTFPRDARHWTQRLRQLSYEPILYVILTDCHGDRVLNSRWLNAPIIAHQQTAERLNSYDKRYPQSLIDSLLMRNGEQGKEIMNSPVDRVTVSFSDEMTVVLDDRRLCLRARPGPSGSSVWVHLPDDGILFAGDTIVADTHPLLVEAQSETWLMHLEELSRANGSYRAVVPGRGRLDNAQAAEQVAAYLRLVRGYVGDHHRRGKPREELSSYINELLAHFPLGNLPRDWVSRQIRLGLDRVYEELKIATEPDLAVK